MFLHNGKWTPEVASRWKMFRYHPGMFKIQIERLVNGIPEDFPQESLMAAIAEEINRRVSKPQSSTTNAPTAGQATHGHPPAGQ